MSPPSPGPRSLASTPRHGRSVGGGSCPPPRGCKQWEGSLQGAPAWSLHTAGAQGALRKHPPWPPASWNLRDGSSVLSQTPSQACLTAQISRYEWNVTSAWDSAPPPPRPRLANKSPGRKVPRACRTAQSHAGCRRCTMAGVAAPSRSCLSFRHGPSVPHCPADPCGCPHWQSPVMPAGRSTHSLPA